VPISRYLLDHRRRKAGALRLAQCSGVVKRLKHQQVIGDP
jgi:hypothetical protein